MKNQLKPLAPLLKKMNIGDKEEYPFRRFTSVKTTIERVQTETGKRFSYKTLETTIEVTRVS